MSAKGSPERSRLVASNSMLPSILYTVVGMRAISFFGDLAAATVIILHLQETGNSALLVVVGLIAATIPAIIFAPLSGAVSDKFGPKRIILVVSVFQCLTVAVMSISNNVPILIAGILVVSIGLAFTNPVYSSLPRRIVEQDDIARAAATSQTAVQVAMLAAPAAGGFMFAAWGLDQSLILTSACYGLIAAISSIATLPKAPQAAAIKTKEDGLGQYSVFRDKGLGSVILSSAAVVAFVSANSVAAVYLVRESFGASAAEYGLLESMWMLGVVLGGLFVARLARRSIARALLLSFALMGTALTLQGLSPWIGLLFILNVFGGLGNGGMATSLHVYINTKVAETHVGRAFAALGAASNAAPFLGFLLGGLLLGAMDPRTVYVVIGTGSLLVTAACGVMLHQHTKVEESDETDVVYNS